MVRAGLILSGSVTDVDPLMLSVTVAVILKVPEELVVPLITPVEAFRLIPGGRLAAGIDQV